MKNIFTGLTIGIIISLSILYFVYRPKIAINAKTLAQLTEVSPTIVPTEYPTATPNPQPPIAANSAKATSPSTAPKAASNAVDINALKLAYAAKHNVSAGSVTLKLSESNGSVAHGFVSSGHWWLGAKSGGTWILVQDGYGYVSCEAIAPYHFPQSMIPICVNHAGRLISL